MNKREFRLFLAYIFVFVIFASLVYFVLLGEVFFASHGGFGIMHNYLNVAMIIICLLCEILFMIVSLASLALSLLVIVCSTSLEADDEKIRTRAMEGV